MKWLLAVGFLLLSSVAHADAPLDRVVLKDGTVLYGRLAELKPNDRLTIVLFSGESRTVEWEELARVSGPSFTDVPSVEALLPPPKSAETDALYEARARALAQLAETRANLVAPAPPPPSRKGMHLFLAAGPALVLGTVYTALGASERTDSITSGLGTGFLSIGAIALAAGTALAIAGTVITVREKKAQARTHSGSTGG
jgi:hypothetical protein